MTDTVNTQITDAVTQTNVKVLGEGPAEAVAIAVQAVAHATSLSVENASQAQGGMQQINNAAVGALIAKILEIPVA
ncbi:RebB family R body protein [Brevundimonas aurantiaca]|uniref:RebB family R body protein n=1 Tax=Brevundimonas aurantiaca TaxID=74316 RepID=UPI00174EB94C|nr:RebB family R body protein [Brevundimonas aurantiaca]